MILVYGDQGRPLYTVNEPWPAALPDMLTNDGTPFCLVDETPIDLVWVDADGVGQAREAGPWTASPTDCAPGADFTVSGLPAGATVRVGGETYTVDDGEFAFTSETPGDYTIRVEHWPFLSSTYEVTFA